MRGRGSIRFKGDERILGSSDFVQDVLKKANERLDQESQIRASGLDLIQLIDRVAARYNIEPAELKTASKHDTITLARRMLCYLAVRKLKLSCTEVARELNISPSAVSRAVNVGSKLPDRDKIQRALLKL